MFTLPISFRTPSKITACFLISASIALVPPTRVHADDLKKIITGIGIGAAIGAAVANSKNNNKKKTQPATRTARSTAPSNPVVRDDANIQRALNHFGFQAGPADGLFGSKTRAAIRRYQEAAGVPVTGTLTQDQRAHLLTQYAKSLNGGSLRTTSKAEPRPPVTTGGTTKSSSAKPQQPRSKSEPNRSAVKILAALDASDLGAASGDDTAKSGDDRALADASLTEKMCAALDTQGALESLEIGQTQDKEDRSRIIGQSYCTSRAWALQQSNDFMSGLPDFEAETVSAQCTEFFDAQKAALFEMLALPADEAATSLKALLSTSNASEQQQYQEFFSVCYGLSEFEANLSQSMVFAALLVGADNDAYGEIVGERLVLGLEDTSQNELGANWLSFTAAALDNGADPLVLPFEGYDHAPLLRAMADIAPSVTVDLDSLVVDTSIQPARKAGGLAIPVIRGVGANAPYNDAYAMRKALLPGFELIYEMSLDEALNVCATGDAKIEVLGTATCKAIALATEEWELAASFDETILVQRQ